MSGLHKLFAGLGVCLAFIAATRLIPQRTVVIKPDRTWHLVPSKDKEPAQSSASPVKRAQQAQSTPALAITGKSVVDTSVPSTQVPASPAMAKRNGNDVSLPDSSETPGIEKETDPASNAPAQAQANTTVLEAASDQPAPHAVPAADPWAAVVTRAGEEPVPAQTDAYAGLNSKPETVNRDFGIADRDPRIAPILAAHPDRDLILCLAGCGKGISVVDVRRHAQPLSAVVAEMVPTSSSLRQAPSAADVVCIAGCVGKPGEVVFKNVRLSWISDEGNTQVKQALRAIADRIVGNEGLDIEAFPRTWVSDVARASLIGGSEAVEPFSFAGPRVAGFIERVRVAALQP